MQKQDGVQDGGELKNKMASIQNKMALILKQNGGSAFA